METNEQKLNALINNITINYANMNDISTSKTKIQKYTECCQMITMAKKLIEELKIEIINMDSNKEKVTREQMSEAKKLNELLQLPGLNFDMLKQIIESLKSMQNSIPTEVTITSNLENEIHVEDFDEIDELSSDDAETGV